MRTTPARTRLSPRLRAAFVALLIAGTSGTAVAATSGTAVAGGPAHAAPEQGHDPVQGRELGRPA
ncbi:hypothetical protein O1M63_13135 [Streptomyces mirabilis]|nr:hypothetical protein [Streptomyces mirabilis]